MIRSQLLLHDFDIRKAIYTTNAIESLNMSLRKVTKNRGHFPSDEAMFKLIYLALKNIAKKWTMPVINIAPTQDAKNTSIRADD